MKASDLMIGDWVSIKPLSGYVYTQRKIKIQDFATLHKMDFAPIPITPEILKKNGFEKKNEKVLDLDLGVCMLYGDYRRIDEDKMVNYGDSLYPIRYVHELQHALRLCGIEKEIVL